MKHAVHNPVQNLSRRGFLQGATGLTLGLALPPLATAAKPASASPAASAPSFEPTPFLRIGADNTVTVISKHLEMGQGTYTGLATIVAEELDASWAQVKVEGAPADAKRYNNLFFGAAQGTGGSTAMANSWGQMRQTGATARAMLVSAAAKRWNVPAADITVSEGVVRHAASGCKASFGELAEAAALEAVPGIEHADAYTAPWYNPGEGGLFSSTGVDLVLWVTIDPEMHVADSAGFLRATAEAAWSINDGYSPQGRVNLIVRRRGQQVQRR